MGTAREEKLSRPTSANELFLTGSCVAAYLQDAAQTILPEPLAAP
jgi:hypothetical protein